MLGQAKTLKGQGFLTHTKKGEWYIRFYSDATLPFDCLKSGRCSRLTTGTSGTRSGGLRKGQSPCELLGGLSGFLSRRCRGLRPCVESVPGPEDSSPGLTWIFGYF